MSNGVSSGNARQRIRHSNWSSLGSLNSFGESTTTPPSSQDHTGSSGSNTNASGQQRETLHSRFDFKQTLGKGTYGKVKLALDKRRNEQVAIKTIKKSRIENPHDLARIRREIDFMTSLNHPYIIKIKEVYESREKIILVMEYASGGELYDYLNRMKRIPESQARAIFRQIVSAVHFLHKNQIVHRDLKLENILIDHNGDIKLADFGLSNSWSPRRLLHTFCGSPLYASPEIVSGIPYYGPEVDCWSLGVLLYTLVYGSMPFQGGDYNRLVRNITSGDFIQPREQSGALSLIQSCLKPDAISRATTKDILRHKWLSHGPVLSIQLNSTTTATTSATSSSSSIPFTDQQQSRNYEKNHIRATSVGKQTSPTDSLVELELHTSAFFDTTRLRDNSSANKDHQRRNRASAIPISTRYLSSHNTKTDSSLLSRPVYRRPVSLTLDDQHPTDEIIQTQSVNNRHSQETSSPTSTTTSATTYDNNDRCQSSHIINQLNLPVSSESTTKAPSCYHSSSDLDSKFKDFQCKTIYKYTSPSTAENNVTTYFPNSTTTNTTTAITTTTTTTTTTTAASLSNFAPSVFTTSAIKFAPVPTRRISPARDQETNSSTNTARLVNNTVSNPTCHNDDSINIATTNTNNDQRSLLTSLELPSSFHTQKNRIIDDNNNLVSLKVFE